MSPVSDYNNVEMSEIQSFKIPPITEPDLDAVIKNAGGSRLHPDHDRRDKIGADYRLGNALIELKCLDEEGLDKVERQEKLHRLFKENGSGQPTITLDRDHLQAPNQRTFDRIMAVPIKTSSSLSALSHGCCHVNWEWSSVLCLC